MKKIIVTIIVTLLTLPCVCSLEAGEYPLTVKYATYSADEELLPKNGADVNCTLVVR